MLASRLLARIEKHWEKIAASVLGQSRRDVLIHHYSRLHDDEVRSDCLDVVHHLKNWVAGEEAEDEIRSCYRRLGAQRLRDAFPLEEVVYMVQTIEWQIVQYVQDENPAQNPVDLYIEVEILRALHRFFGIAVHSLVAGYESARNRAISSSAA